MSKRGGNSRFIFLALIAAVIVCGIFFILLFNVEENGAPVPEETPEDVVDEEEPETEDGWVTYTNDEFNFSMEHPADWTVRAFPTDLGSPKFNFFPEGTDTAGLPFTHHSEGVTHVSVFPHGIPTEGFFGETAETNVNFAVPTEQARDYILADRTHFATIAFMPEGGTNWTPSGFVFAHTVVQNSETVCMRGAAELPPEACDPLTGDVIVREGEIDADVRNTQVRMLESFRFTE